MVLECLWAPISIGSVKVTFCHFQSLCSSDDTNRHTSSPYISKCIACSALLFGPNMYLSKTYKPYKKRTSSMRINRVITVLPISRLNFYRVQCKIVDPFSPWRFPRFPWLPFTSVGIINLRMRICLQHRRCLPLPAIGVKLFIFLNVWQPILKAPFHRPLRNFAGLFVWMSSTNVPYFS